jgi:serine/threonine-protein kinase
MTLAPAELAEFLTKNQLLSHTQLEAVAREADHFVSAAQMSDELVARGWLTKFQQSHLLSGQGDKLILGPYRLVDSLGEGGMGLVYKGWHPRLDRYVALKLIRPQVLASRPEIITRFHREARAVAQLHHPNVVMLYDADEVNGTHFIAMEFVDGVTLEKMVRQSGPLAIKQACDYMRQSALGLQHAAECGLVHRDIKPSNILVTQRSGGAAKRSSSQLRRPALITVRDRELKVEGPSNSWGIIKILDMGLARLQESLEEDEENPSTPLTRAGALLGTPDFISPEQARDARNVDIRADLYSLGCTFYYILAGRPPFPGGNDVQKLIKHQTEQPYPLEDLRPHVPTVVSGIVARLMAKNPEERYQAPQGLADALGNYMATASPSSYCPPPRKAEVPSEPPASVPASPFASAPPILPDLLAGFDDSAVTGEPTNALTEMTSSPPSFDIAPTTLTPAHTGLVSAIAITPEGRHAATGGVDGKICVWDLAAGRPREVARLSRAGTEIQAVAFAPDDPKYLVYGCSARGNVRLERWDWIDNNVVEWGSFTTTGHRGIGRIAFAPDGSMFAAGIGTFGVTWRIGKRVASTPNVLKGHGDTVLALAYSPDHRLLATAGEAGAIRLWGFGWLGTSLKATIRACADGVTALAFSPDGKRLASVGIDRNVSVWDAISTGSAPITQLAGTEGNLRHVQFLPGGQQILCMSDIGHVVIWDVSTTLVVAEFSLDFSLTYSAAVSPDGKRVVAGYSNGHIAVFNLNPAATTNLAVASSAAGKR